MQQLSFHPLADVYPLMDATELAELAASIERNGLREPIVLHRDGRILDGRHRYMAARSVGVEPRFTEFTGTDHEALEYVVDTNTHRRHLTESQRAIVAAKLVGFGHGGARGKDREDSAGLTHRQAAERLGIGERSVRDGKLVLDLAPDEMTTDVQEGRLAVRAAAEIIRAAGKDRELIAEYHRLRRASGSEEWYTPPHIISLVVELMGEIDLDPCSNDAQDPWVPARRHLTKSDDGLAQTWAGRVFVNPPWTAQGSPGPWLAKLIDDFEAGAVTEAVFLAPARTNTAWAARAARFPRVFVRGRLKFGDASGFAPFPVMLIYVGHRADRFAKVFSRIGDVYALLAPMDA